MSGADPEKAIRYLKSFGRLEHPGACLYYVWLAYKAGGASTTLSARTATEAWGKTSGRHLGDRNPPRGAAVWWGPKKGSSAGDVVISLGGGRVIATDQPRYGVVGEATIAERERLIGRPYLGWSDHIFDAPIAITALAGDETTHLTPSRPAPPTPHNPDPGEDDMELERLMQIDLAVSGAWYRVNYGRGTAVKVANGYQLDRAKEECEWEAKAERPRIIRLGGPQPAEAIQGLTIING